MHHGLPRPHLLLLVAALAAISMIEAVSHDPSGDPRRHVCIIGGGIAGATAVHYLANATRLTLFEASLRLGGRIASTQLAPGLRVEAGASVLAAENRLFGALAADLGLARKEPGVGGGEVRLGLWDGRAFRYVSSGRPWVDAGRMLWRYGRPLLRMRRYVATLLDTFGGLYVGADAGHDTVEKLLARAPGLFDLTQKSFDKTAGAAFGGGQLVEELVSAITRVNYNQDVKQMNGLSGAVAIAGSGGGLWAVDGGNEQVPRGLILRSNSTVHLGTRISRVDEILDDDTGSATYVLEDENDKHRVTCDAVVIAAPLEGSGIKFGGSIAATSWDVGRHFQRTVATFIHGTLSTAYFGDDPPEVILTTAHALAPFSSLARIRAAEGGGFFYKIFSKTHLGKETLNQLFDAGARVVDTHDWLAYPQFSPPESFSGFRVGTAKAAFYTGPIESVASAMEMSALSGLNAAALVRNALHLPLEALLQGSDATSIESSRSEL